MDDDNGRNETLDGLERDAERDRAELAGTVEALRGRLGSGGGGLSDQVRGYAKHRRSEAVEGIWRRLEDNPLQTVAMAAGIAYPVVRIVRKIPAPILLLGAGVALAGRGGPEGSDDHVDIVTESADDMTMFPPSDRGFREPRTSVGSDTSPDAQGASVNARRDRAAAASELGARAMRAGSASGETLVEAVRRNPVVAGGVSLLIGAAFAAMLPRTRVEGRAFGDAAEDVRDQARSLAAEGVEAGRRAIGAAASEAEKQNLTGESAQDAIQSGADRAGKAIRDTADEVQEAIEGSAGAKPDDAPKGKSD